MSTVTNNHNDGRSGRADLAGLMIPDIDVAVVGVCAARTRTAPSARTRTPWTAMEDYAALVRARTPIRPLRLPLTTGAPREVADRIAGLPHRVSAAFLTGLGWADSLTVQRAVAERGGPLVITETDLLTVTLVASTITTLRHRRVPPRTGRVVIAGVNPAPLLAPVLMASGVGNLSSWHERDAQALPLRRVMEHHDVLIDLGGSADDQVAPSRTVRPPDDPFTDGALVLPGLLSAVCGHGALGLTVDVIAACVRALALITPVDRVLPALDDRLLVSAVARHAGRTLGDSVPLRDRQQ